MRYLLLALLALALVAPVIAQDDQMDAIMEAVCAPDGITEVLTLAIGEIAAGNVTFSEFVTSMATLNAACQGLHFTGEQYGDIGVIGPLELSGTYIARFNAPTDTYNGVTVTELDGDCDERLLFSDADPITNATVAFQPECTALIEVESGPGWELSLEPLD